MSLWTSVKDAEAAADAAEKRTAQLQSELDNSDAAYVAKCETVAELQRIVSELVAERDIAAYQATMTASRAVYDLSMMADNDRVRDALRLAFRQIAREYAEVKS